MNKEILLMVDVLSHEKGVEKKVIFDALERALESATKRYHTEDIGVHVVIDQHTGAFRTYRYWDVMEVDAIENPARELSVSEARKQSADDAIQLGDRIEAEMESIEFGRIAAQTAKQVIVQKVREAERAQTVSIYEGKVGTIVSGTVKKVSRELIIVDLGENAEAIMLREDMIPRESFRINDRIRACLYKIDPEARGIQLFLSRTHPEMIHQLFRTEVPEIAEEVIEIKAVARDPGSRAKMVVKTNDGRIDPVGACVGMRGSRVQAVSSELGGERIDIIVWNDNPAQLVINALSPAEVASILVDEDARAMDVIVSEEQLAIAIGRNGQNVRLASDLTGWKINVMTEADAEAKHAGEAQKVIETFKTELDVDDEVAQVLVEEGFTSLEEIVYVPESELATIDGFDTETISELRERARDALLTNALAIEENVVQAEQANDLNSLEGMTPELAALLTKNAIVSQEDLAEMATDDLLALEGIELNEKDAAALIMAARAPWFAEEDDA